MNPLEIPDDTKPSAAAYALRAWLVSVIPALLYFFALVYIGADSLRPPARARDPAYAAYSIFVAPLLETALMFPLVFLLKLSLPRHGRAQLVLLAAICSLAHRIGGGWEQVFASFWPFLIYSVTLTTWLKRSRGAAFVLTALVHALYNATFFAVGALGVILTVPR